jgi:hypothetical protein
MVPQFQLFKIMVFFDCAGTCTIHKCVLFIQTWQGEDKKCKINSHSSSHHKIYIKRWPIEVCFKECKQQLELGKDQSNDFNAQVFATTLMKIFSIT